MIANCPVVDWKILDRSEKAETSNENYCEYIRKAFGNGYRLSDANWEKLKSGTFYSPWHHRTEISGSKVMIFHPKDDPHVPYEGSNKFAEITGVKLKTLQRGGHISTDYVVRRHWAGDQEVLRFRREYENKIGQPGALEAVLKPSRLEGQLEWPPD